MQNEEMAPCATGELASVRSSVLALWRPFESFGLVWELSLSATCISDELAVAVTVGMWLLLKNLSTGKKWLNCCSTLQFYFFFSMYKTPELQPCFPCCMVMKKSKFGRCSSGFTTEKSGWKNCKVRFFFFFSSCYNRLGSVKKQLFDNMFWTASMEFWHWMLWEQSKCSHPDFGVEFCWFLIFFLTAALVWFLPVRCYCRKSFGHQMITEILDMQS